MTAAASSGRVVQYGYDAATGRLSTVTDEHGGIWRMTYTVEGWLKDLSDPTGVVVISNSYDPAGRVVSQAGPSGGVTSFTYFDGTGETRVTDSVSGQTVVYAHDHEGRVIMITDPYGNAAQQVFDGRSNLIAVTSRDGSTSTATYDAAENMTSTNRPGVGVTAFEYDASSRLTATTDPWGGRTVYGYDGTERIASTITDPGRNVTSYDVVNGMVNSVIDPDGVKVTIGYDALRRPITQTDAYANTTTTAYDAKNRVKKVTTPSGE